MNSTFLIIDLKIYKHVHVFRLTVDFTFTATLYMYDSLTDWGMHPVNNRVSPFMEYVVVKHC